MIGLNKYKDIRSYNRFKNDIDVGSDNSRKAVVGYCAYLNCLGNGIAHCKTYKEVVWTDDDIISNKIDFKQDADVYYNNELIPLEVKVAPDGLPEKIYLRYWSVKSIANIDGKILLVSGQEFALVDPKEIVAKCPVIDVEIWGGKKGFVILKSDYNWKRFISPVNFISHRK